jgi:hypothetical protein
MCAILSSPGTRLTGWPRYLCDGSNPHAGQAALMRLARPPGLARAPCSRVRSCLTGMRNRGRVLKVSTTYRGHGVHYEPGPHTMCAIHAVRFL